MIPAGVYNPHLKDYVEMEMFFHYRWESLKKVQRAFVGQNFRSNKITRNSFVVFEGEREEGSVIWASYMLLTFRLNNHMNSSKAEHVFGQNMQLIPALHEMDKVLSYVCL